MAASAAAARRLAVITGASQGYGRAVAKALAKASTGGQLEILLAARSLDGLSETAKQVGEINQNVSCQTVQLDLADHLGVEAFAKEVVQSKLEQNKFSEAVFISNAGTLYPLGRIDAIASTMSVAELSRQMDINLTSHLWLSSFIAAAFQQHISKDAIIVNVSSLAAIQALPTWGAYCSHKAARDMGLATAAAEGAAPSAKCALSYLNWAPGPMDGNMQEVIRTDPAVDPSLRDWSSKALADGELVPMQHSADALGVLLAQAASERCWKSGEHVDFFDEPVQAAWKAVTASQQQA